MTAFSTRADVTISPASFAISGIWHRLLAASDPAAASATSREEDDRDG
jgi:hypothetical protein